MRRRAACLIWLAGGECTDRTTRSGQESHELSSQRLELGLRFLSTTSPLGLEFVGMPLSTSQLSSAVRAARAVRPQVRCLATPSSSKPSFKQTLEDGPSLDDFIADRVSDRVVLGNTKA